MAKVIIIGPAHPLRGGLATFNHRLAKQFIDEGHQCSIYSFSLQYPGFLFPGSTQFTDEPAPEDLHVNTVINSINPFNWIKTGKRIRKENADLVIVRYWLPFMGPALGTINRQIRKNRETKIICIADNVLPHEKRFGDKSFTRYFLKSCDAFVTMSEKVMKDLRIFQPDKPAITVAHPLYDNFGEIIGKSAARMHLGLSPQGKLLLFFGFIRKYKGLDILLDAIADPRIRANGIRLMVAGEFYENAASYHDQIQRLGISDLVVMKTEFIPDSEVRYFLSATDAVIQPYRNATQSGVTPLAYHFEKPMVVTNVGGLPALVPHNIAGLVVEPNAAAIAEGILSFYQLGEQFFIPQLRVEKQKYTWSQFVSAVMKLANI